MTQPIQGPLTNAQMTFLRDAIVQKDLLIGWSYALCREMAVKLHGLGLWRLEPDEQGSTGITDEGLRRIGTPHARRILRNRIENGHTI